MTCVLDWSHIHNTPEHSDAVIKGLADSGVRAVFAYGNPQNETGRYWEMPGHKFPGDIARLRKQYFSSEDQLLTLYMAAPSGAPELVLESFKAARDVGARITIHVGVGEFGRSGLGSSTQALKSDTTTSIAGVERHRMEADKDTSGTISIASYVEMLMATVLRRFKGDDTGIRPSLSVDVETSVPNDFFQQMRSIFSLRRSRSGPRLAGDKPPRPCRRC